MDTLTDFLFAEFEEGKSVEVLRVGTFVDRNGRTVAIAEEDLDVFVANFQAGAAGQEVPIDVNHEKSEAGGWIRNLARDGEKLVAVPEWNELGRKLVGERIYRYLSATIDLAKKLIKSVSLVNFPAVKGLKPVELSEGIYSFQVAPGLVETLVSRVTQAVMDVLGREEASSLEEGSPPEEVEEAEFVIRKENNEIVLYSANGEKVLGRFPFGPGEKYSDEEAAREAAKEREEEINRIKHVESEEDMDEQQVQELREQIRQEIEADLAAQEQDRAEMREQIRAEVEAEMAGMLKKRDELREFAEKVTSGDFGLATKPEEIVELLAGIEDEEQLKRVQAMLEAKVVDFSERGSSREGQGGKQKLPSAYAVLVRAWQDEGHDLAEFFEVNKDELGDMDQYDLSEFEKQE